MTTINIVLICFCPGHGPWWSQCELGRQSSWPLPNQQCWGRSSPDIKRPFAIFLLQQDNYRIGEERTRADDMGRKYPFCQPLRCNISLHHKWSCMKWTFSPFLTPSPIKTIAWNSMSSNHRIAWDRPILQYIHPMNRTSNWWNPTCLVRSLEVSVCRLIYRCTTNGPALVANWTSSPSPMLRPTKTVAWNSMSSNHGIAWDMPILQYIHPMNRTPNWWNSTCLVRG